MYFGLLITVDLVDSDIVLAILGCRKMRHSHEKGRSNSTAVETVIRISRDGIILECKNKGREYFLYLILQKEVRKGKRVQMHFSGRELRVSLIYAIVYRRAPIDSGDCR